ncbi:MAG: hypothetical protein RLZZ237_2484, partial [Pseudomonadota bacterium]
MDEIDANTIVSYKKQAVAALAAAQHFTEVALNVKPHQRPGYVAVVLSLKKTGVPPG